MPIKLCVAYTVVSGGPKTTDFVARFVSTWKQNPPGVQTDVLAICNGGPPNTEQAVMLSSLGAKVFVRSNLGWDLQGFREASKGPLFGYDAVLFLGESVFFWKEGWLKRLDDVYSRWGHGMYGPYGSHVVRAHLQTTAFMTSPKLFAEYPFPITDRASRYSAEHGEQSYWRVLHHRKFPVRLVTWDGDYPPGQWRMPRNIIWKGDQSNVLFWCNHTSLYFESDPKRKRMWQASADRPFR